MAFTASYNGTKSALTNIFSTTGGGTIFSANQAGNAVFDYFSDTAVVNDALYFSVIANSAIMSDFDFNVGTAMAGTGITLAWEYYKYGGTWSPIEDLKDDTLGFTVTGANSVRFPLQWQPKMVAINGIGADRMWIRCRISALTTITQGGANQTATVKTGNGVLTVSGTTDAVPATFTDIYNWLRTNLSYISVTFRNGNCFNFTKVGLTINSRLITTDEEIEIGQDCIENLTVGSYQWKYLTSGVKVGTDRGYKGSTFIVYGVNNSSIGFFYVDTKLYGTTFKVGKLESNSAQYPGYWSIRGEVIDCNLEMSPSFDGVSTAEVITNTRLLTPTILGFYTRAAISGLSVVATSNYIFFTYFNFTGQTITYTNFDYTFVYPSSRVVMYFYSSSEPVNPTYAFLNPKKPLPALADANKPVGLNGGGLTNCDKVFFYDDSAGTYTDYTTAAGDATANDVPLTGDVNDCLYFGTNVPQNTYGRSYMHLYITKTTGANDYVYAFEYYLTGTWYPITTYLFDGTENLSKSGYVLIAIPNTVIKHTINGTTDYWLRARIVTKGVTFPVATKIQNYHNRSVAGWSVQEQYTIDTIIVDATGSAISGAIVVASYTGGATIFTATTGVAGSITQQFATGREWHLDATQATLIKETVTQSIVLTVSKAGYETYVMLGIQLGKKLDLTISLKPVTRTRYTIEGKPLRALTPESGSSSKLLEI